MLEHETILASGADIRLPGHQCPPEGLRDPPLQPRPPDGLRGPPLHEHLRLRPRLENDARRGVESSSDDELPPALPIQGRLVLHGCGLISASSVHSLSPCVSVLRRPCPVRRSARPRAGGVSPATPFLPPGDAGRSCRFARGRSSPW